MRRRKGNESRTKGGYYILNETYVRFPELMHAKRRRTRGRNEGGLEEKGASVFIPHGFDSLCTYNIYLTVT